MVAAELNRTNIQLETEKGPSVLPPYLPYCAATGLIESIELITCGKMRQIGKDLLIERDIARGLEYKVLGALRFLDLINPEGKITERAHQLRRKASFRPTLLEIIKDSYGEPLFQTVSSPNQPRETVMAFMMENGVPWDTAKKAALNLVILYKMATTGIETIKKPKRKFIPPPNPQMPSQIYVGFTQEVKEVLTADEQEKTLAKVRRAWARATRETGQEIELVYIDLIPLTNNVTE